MPEWLYNIFDSYQFLAVVASVGLFFITPPSWKQAGLSVVADAWAKATRKSPLSPVVVQDDTVERALELVVSLTHDKLTEDAKVVLDIVHRIQFPSEAAK